MKWVLLGVVVVLAGAPVARAEEPLTIHISISLQEFVYYADWDSCHGGIEGKNGQPATWGYDPGVAVALRGVNTGDVSLGTAMEDSQAFGGRACVLEAYVTVDKPDPKYQYDLKWGPRPWKHVVATTSERDEIRLMAPNLDGS